MDLITQTIQINDYQPHPQNYNQHPDDQLAKLAASLSKFGQVRNIVVWQNYIVAGHGIVFAAQSLGWETLSANVIPDETDESVVLAYLVADNELAKKSDPDDEQLASLLSDLRQTDHELFEVTGWDSESLDKLLTSLEVPIFDPVDVSDQPSLDQKSPVICPHCHQEFIPK